MRLREVMGAFLAFPLFLLGGCFKDPTAAAYEKLVSIPQNAQRCNYFSALPDEDRVSLYMYGATKVKPRDFVLGECFSEVDVGLWRELMTRLAASRIKCNAVAEKLDLLCQRLLGRSPSQGLPGSPVEQSGNVVQLGLGQD